jgi:RHH-type transcriptional regulator, proline utilization regulon repressor / proline dehydrogenase / delta 1-pyrroline-5-carboxylate dehydrogenase
MPTSFELQMLHGMAEPIAESYRKLGYLVRQYIPIGELLPGMGYLVRRLLENTSNESFLKHTFFDSREIKQLLSDPRSKLDH